MPELIEPDPGRHSAWLESHREWGPGLHEDGFGIGPDDEVESAADFAAWVDKLRSRPARLWGIVEQEVVLGGIALRPFTNDDALRTGHIGYGNRPSARGRGLDQDHRAGRRRPGRDCRRRARPGAPLLDRPLKALRISRSGDRLLGGHAPERPDVPRFGL